MPRSERLWRALQGLALLGFLVLAAPRARAEHLAPSEPSLFSRGRVLIAGSLTGSWSNDASVYGALERWQVYGYPSASYFVRDRIGLGLTLGGGASRSEYRGLGHIVDHDFIVGAQGAFAVPLTPRLSLLFRPVLAYVREWRDRTVLPTFGSLTAAPGALVQRPLTDSLKFDIARALLAIQLVIRLAPNVGLALGLESWVDRLFGDTRGATLRQSNNPELNRTAELWRVQVGLNAGLVIAL